MLVMCTTWLPGPINDSRARVHRKTINTLTSNCMTQSSSVVSENGLLMRSPALWISPSSCSFSDKTPETAWETSARSVSVVYQCSSPGWSAEKVANSACRFCLLRPFAASRFVRCCPALSLANWSLETEPPFSARSVATFCKACVNTATETSPKLNASPTVAAPNEYVPVVVSGFLIHKDWVKLEMAGKLLLLLSWMRD